MAGKSPSWQEQLLTLRAVTATTGVMHEAQVLQLRMWGSICLDGTQWEAKVDPTDKTVLYVVKTKISKKAMRTFAGPIAALDRSIHWLLGDDWLLKIEWQGNLLYEGKRALPDTNGQRKSRRKDRKG